MIYLAQTLFNKYYPKGFKANFISKYFPFYEENIGFRLMLIIPLMVGAKIFFSPEFNKSTELLVSNLMVLPFLSFMCFLFSHIFFKNVIKTMKCTLLFKMQDKILADLKENIDSREVQEALYQFSLMNICLKKNFDNKLDLIECLDLFEHKTIPSNPLKELSEWISHNPTKQVKTYKTFLDMSLTQLETYTKTYVAQMLAPEQGIQEKVNVLIKQNLNKAQDEKIFKTNKTLSTSL